ncbi:MAG TPA: M28 family peptidase, partial [Thermoanaerobaculia bacterium]|nr:M28 family peptidase [Thermoanaerobaculia bacterium]
MRRLAAIVLPLALVLAIAIWRSHGPAPVNEAAFRELQALVAEGTPHPVGSPENAVVRERIVARFRALGYDVTTQRRFVCNARITCATVENILARLPGQSAETVVLAAHYDSVKAGAGASDDAMGVAALLDVAAEVRGERF